MLKHMFEIAGKLLKWMTSYPSGRHQTVTIDEKSEPVLINFSVPQGSVFGPKFYAMYTTPIGAICKKYRLESHFYADAFLLSHGQCFKDRGNPAC